VNVESRPGARQAGGLCEPPRRAGLGDLMVCACRLDQEHTLNRARGRGKAIGGSARPWFCSTSSPLSGRDMLMSTLLRHARRFLVNEDGPTAVEYAVMLALIIVVCLVSIQLIGTNANLTFNSVATKLAGGS
jgi:pilus assembly protein Flp/PilA